MELIDTILPEVYRYAIGWTILHSIWQILCISLVLYISLSLFNKRSAAFKYRLSFASLLLIMGTGIITFAICLSQAEIKGAETTTVIMSSPSLNSPITNPYSYTSYLLAEFENYIPLLVNIWLVGAALFLFRLGSNFSTLKNLRKSAKIDISDYWARFAHQQKMRMGITRTLSILTSKDIQCPITFGSIKPIILIPASLVLYLTPAQLEAIITHELAHIKRNDYLHNIIQSAMEALFFYHPCFWWINAYVREQRENACDDVAIQAGINPKDLAYGLAEVLNHAQEPTPEMALAAGSRNHPTLSRIKRMLGFENQKPKFPSIISYTMIFTMLISASLVLGASHVSTLEKDKFLITQSHFTQNIPLELPPFQVIDTVPQKKQIYIIDKEENVYDGTTEAEPTFKNKLIIINGDTQRVFLPNKPLLAIFGDSIMADFPRIKMDSIMITKFKNIEFDTTFQKKFRTYKFDTAILDKEIIKKLERNAKEMERHSKDLEKQIHVWTNKNQPRLEELQQRLKEKEVMLNESHEKFTKEIEPHLKELEKKMDEWQKEFAPKMEEFQRKMEIWQNENSKQLEELHKTIQESVKKGDN